MAHLLSYPKFSGFMNISLGLMLGSSELSRLSCIHLTFGKKMLNGFSFYVHRWIGHLSCTNSLFKQLNSLAWTRPCLQRFLSLWELIVLLAIILPAIFKYAHTLCFLSHLFFSVTFPEPGCINS